MDGLDFDSSGVLYALSQSSAVDGRLRLFTLNTGTGQPTLIGDIGVAEPRHAGNEIVADIAFAPDGTLYGVLDDSLYTISKSTGAATLIGATGFRHLSGLAFLDMDVDTENPTPVPEPGTFVVVAGALLALASRKR